MVTFSLQNIREPISDEPTYQAFFYDQYNFLF